MWLEAAPGYQLKKGKKQNRGKRGREGNIKIVHGHPGMFLRHVSAVRPPTQDGVAHGLDRRWS